MVSMEKLHRQDVLFTLLLLIYSSSNLLLASGYTLPNKYFINCGSSSNATVDRRNFVGDVNSSSSYFSVRPSDDLKDGNPETGTSSLYRTARIFRKESSYEFRITENGTYLVRFHFYPFLTPTNLTAALFNVRVTGYSLLSNFRVQNRSNSPVIKEFAIPIEVGNFTIYFTPEKSSLAFVNAVEAFLAPEKFVSNESSHITPAGSDGNYRGLESQALQIIHRINVGGPKIPPNNDTLWRSWTPDDDYLLLPGSAKNSEAFNNTPKYDPSEATNYSAPVDVYKTAKELDRSYSSSSSFFNVTWAFRVNKNSTYFVRVHFCDIISQDEDGIVFNFSIYSRFIELVYSYGPTTNIGTPFYKDYVVDSDDSSLMNISIGPRSESPNKTAFLNGLEIMELITKESGSLPAPSKPKKTVVFVMAGCVVGVAFLLILLGVILKCRKANSVESGEWSMLLYGGRYFSWITGTGRAVETSSVSSLNLGLKIPFSEILHATHRFDKKSMIGKGGFGKVYRGTLRDGKKVAVKRSQPGRGQGLYEFQTEIIVLNKIRHRHLVSLIGYCDEMHEMILVYEFMENGTLRDRLYNWNKDCTVSTPRSQLSWEQRLEICIGSAWGLDYLHSDSGIIHRDVKSTNILLDENYVAKVADFGLSKSSGTDQTHVSTDVKGSPGYLDPEYFRCMQLTDKSDVYSFGVVLLEVLCARPAIKSSVPSEETNLAEWAMSWQKKGELEKIVDPFLVGKINPNSLRKFGETAEKCLKDSGAERPTMRDVLWDLKYALDLQQATTLEEGYADSTTDAFSEMPLLGVQSLPSSSFPLMEKDDVARENDDGSDPTPSDVFSQLRIIGAR
ncbi:probable receptor-like protein kinase At5g24010 [Vitis riparia]|uniref:probable receptor-like protein kinase At5g24010 n=1 Tax=Vitis riparia TaxID=96939 RepID=UPI00155A0758|nr:probable receptor-like protein kinase At5g24010 [Vitis riparia]